MATPRFGLIGCSPRAIRSVLPAFRHIAADLVAIADADDHARQFTRRHFGARRAYRDYRDMVEKEILDAVVVGMTTPLEPARYLLQMGVPALLLTPDRLAAGEAHALAATAAAIDVNIGMLAWPRFDAATRTALDHIRERHVGDPVSTAIRAVRSLPAGDEDVAGRILGGFLPIIDIALLASCPVERLIFDRADLEGVMRCTALAHQVSGAILTLELTALPQGRAERWQLEHTGTAGRLSMQGTGTVEVELWDLDEVGPGETLPRRSEVINWESTARVDRAFQRGLAEFGAAVLERRPFADSLASFVPAIRVAEILAGPVGEVSSASLRVA